MTGLAWAPLRDDVVRMMDELMLDYYRNRAHERPGALASCALSWSAACG